MWLPRPLTSPEPPCARFKTRFLCGSFRPVDEAEKLSFQERVQKGFAESMGTGLDYFAGIASILMRIGDAFTQGSRQMKLSSAMLQPAVVSRLLTALVKSKMEGRGLLPKDIWQPKGIVASGMDVVAVSGAHSQVVGTLTTGGICLHRVR